MGGLSLPFSGLQLGAQCLLSVSGNTSGGHHGCSPLPSDQRSVAEAGNTEYPILHRTLSSS